MVIAVFRRRSTDGVAFGHLVDAWDADRGFGVPARACNAVSMDDTRALAPSSTESLLVALRSR